jgi:hypothetical protein
MCVRTLAQRLTRYLARLILLLVAKAYKACLVLYKYRT